MSRRQSESTLLRVAGQDDETAIPLRALTLDDGRLLGAGRCVVRLFGLETDCIAVTLADERYICTHEAVLSWLKERKVDNAELVLESLLHSRERELLRQFSFDTIVIEVSGGAVQCVHTPRGSTLKVVLVDWDDIEEGDKSRYFPATPYDDMTHDTRDQIMQDLLTPAEGGDA